MNGRAETSEQKRAVVERILAAWEKVPELRLGQLIASARDAAPQPRAALFYVEDEVLAASVERFAGVAYGPLYRSLAAKWHEDMRFVSSMHEMVADPSARAIVAMGPAVIPLLLVDMEYRPSWLWPLALAAITGESPVKVESAGRLHAVCADWFEWAASRNRAA